MLCDDPEGQDRGRDGGDVCIIMTDFHCCTEETNTTLKGNFFPIKKLII